MRIKKKPHGKVWSHVLRVWFQSPPYHGSEWLATASSNGRTARTALENPRMGEGRSACPKDQSRVNLAYNNECAPANHRSASPLGAGLEFGRALHRSALLTSGGR